MPPRRIRASSPSSPSRPTTGSRTGSWQPTSSCCRTRRSRTRDRRSSHSRPTAPCSSPPSAAWSSSPTSSAPTGSAPYDGALDAVDLAQGASSGRGPPRAAAVDLSALDWARIARDTVEAYRAHPFRPSTGDLRTRCDRRTAMTRNRITRQVGAASGNVPRWSPRPCSRSRSSRDAEPDLPARHLHGRVRLGAAGRAARLGARSRAEEALRRGVRRGDRHADGPAGQRARRRPAGRGALDRAGLRGAGADGSAERRDGRGRRPARPSRRRRRRPGPGRRSRSSTRA